MGRYSTGKLSRIDPATSKVVATADVSGGNPSSINVGGDELWVGGRGINGAQIFGLESMKSAQSVAIGPASGFAVVAGSAIWYPCYGSTTIARVDIVSHAVTATVEGGSSPVYAVAFAESIWVADHSQGRVTRIDAKTGLAVAAIDVPGLMLYGMAPSAACCGSRARTNMPCSRSTPSRTRSSLA